MGGNASTPEQTSINPAQAAMESMIATLHDHGPVSPLTIEGNKKIHQLSINSDFKDLPPMTQEVLEKAEHVDRSKLIKVDAVIQYVFDKPNILEMRFSGWEPKGGVYGPGEIVVRINPNNPLDVNIIPLSGDEVESRKPNGIKTKPPLIGKDVYYTIDTRMRLSDFVKGKGNNIGDLVVEMDQLVTQAARIPSKGLGLVSAK